MSGAGAPEPPVPATGPAGWILVAGLSVSLHLAALTAVTLALAGQPRPPAAAPAGIVIRTMPPVMGSTLEPGRAQRAPAPERQAASEPTARLRAEDAAQAKMAETSAARSARVADARIATRLSAEGTAPAETAEESVTPERPDRRARLAPAGPAPQRAAPGAQAQRLGPKARAGRTGPDPGSTSAETATARRIAPDGAEPAASQPARAAALRAPTERAAQTDRARTTPAPLPEQPERRPNRARRDGPDRRLSDRQAASADGTGHGPDLGRAQLLLQDLHDTPCHLVIPLPGGLTGLAVLGTDRDRLHQAGERLSGAFSAEARPTLATHPIAAPQCPVLDFAHAAGDSPERGILLDLWRPTVSESRPLVGTLVHDQVGTLHLLLADTAGQVHDLTRFLRPAPDGSDFSVPITGGADPAGARQMLIAIATPVPLRSLSARQGPRDTADLFDDLARELAAVGLVPDLAIAAFVFE